MSEDFTKTLIRAVAAADHAFLLDAPSGALHERNMRSGWREGSILFGWEPVEVLTVAGGGGGHSSGDPFELLKGLLATLDEGGGAIAVGYIAYDAGGRVEPTAASRLRDNDMPELVFAVYDSFWEYEVATGELFRCGVESRRPTGVGEVERLAGLMGSCVSSGGVRSAAAVSDFTRHDYMAAVAAAREYILSGDIFEVNLSQCFRTKIKGEPWDLYNRLRTYNPASYAAFLSMPAADILSSSPELFLRVEGDKVTTRPIKGTIARGATPRQDEKAVARLLASPKDNAELAMIIDLMRNDLGRVCRYGSVNVVERSRVETFARVHHLVSTVEGRLEAGTDICELLKATFPGGSITGAPKVRAMQIIDELEPCRRGVYTGSIGYFLPGGRAELNIAIRTMVCRDGEVELQVGGAVTADSDPAAEYDETLAKAHAMMDALALE